MKSTKNAIGNGIKDYLLWLVQRATLVICFGLLFVVLTQFEHELSATANQKIHVFKK